ncbi:hydroxyphenylpyruvate reductase [Tanacetum coccineum]
MNRVTLNMPRESPFVPLLSIAPSLSPATLLHEPLSILPMRRVTSPPDPNKGYLGFERKTTYRIRLNRCSSYIGSGQPGLCSMNPYKIRGWQFRIRSREHRDNAIIVIAYSLYVLSQYAIGVLHKPEIICYVKSDTDGKKTLEAFKSDKEPNTISTILSSIMLSYLCFMALQCLNHQSATLVHNSNLLGLLEAEVRNANDKLITLSVLELLYEVGASLDMSLDDLIRNNKKKFGVHGGRGSDPGPTRCFNNRGAQKEHVDSLPGLEIVSGFSIGLDKVDLGYDEEKGFKVTNRPYLLTDDVDA